MVTHCVSAELHMYYKQDIGLESANVNWLIWSDQIGAGYHRNAPLAQRKRPAP